MEGHSQSVPEGHSVTLFSSEGRCGFLGDSRSCEGTWLLCVVSEPRPLSGGTLCSWGCGHRSRPQALQDGSLTHSQQSTEVTGAARSLAAACRSLLRLHLDAGWAHEAYYKIPLRLEQQVLRT